MPMIDIYATEGTFSDKKVLVQKAADLVKTVEAVPDIPMFRKNTAAFLHELPESSLSNVDGESDYVRVQILTNQGALDRNKQLELTEKMTNLVAELAGREDLKKKTWILLTEATAGGWGLWGHAHENDELVSAAREEIGKLTQGS